MCQWGCVCVVGVCVCQWGCVCVVGVCVCQWGCVCVVGVCVCCGGVCVLWGCVCVLWGCVCVVGVCVCCGGVCVSVFISSFVSRRKSPAHSAGPGSTYSHSSDSESAVSDSGTSSESDSDRSVPSLTPSLSPARKKKRRRDHTGSRHHHKKGHHSREMVAREREGSRKHKKRRREMAEDLSDGRRQKKKRRHHRSRRHEKTGDSESHLVSSDTATTSDTTHHKKKKKRRRRESDGVDGAAAGVAGEGGLEGEGEGTEMVEEESESPGESLGRERVGGVEVGVAKNPISGEGSPVVSADGDVSEQVNRADGESVNDEGTAVEVEEPAKVVGEGVAGCGTGEEVGVVGRRGSSGDQLLKDIDQLLAEDDDMQPSPSGSGPVGNTLEGTETVARGGGETLGIAAAAAAAPAGENSDQEMAEGERDNVSLHVDSDTIDDNTFSGVGNMEGTSHTSFTTRAKFQNPFKCFSLQDPVPMGWRKGKY